MMQVSKNMPVQSFCYKCMPTSA